MEHEKNTREESLFTSDNNGEFSSGTLAHLRDEEEEDDTVDEDETAEDEEEAADDEEAEDAL